MKYRIVERNDGKFVWEKEIGENMWQRGEGYYKTGEECRTNLMDMLRITSKDNVKRIVEEIEC